VTKNLPLCLTRSCRRHSSSYCEGRRQNLGLKISRPQPAQCAHHSEASQWLTLRQGLQENVEILGLLMVLVRDLPRQVVDSGDRARIINDGPDGGQEAMHLHVHVLGGRAMQCDSGQGLDSD
jgi:hypothetical protein